ncbi:hypothetical protein V1506DRAFT_246254 [Lipomyces tetrasporus]
MVQRSHAATRRVIQGNAAALLWVSPTPLHAAWPMQQRYMYSEATDMDEFELDLLGLSWAHVTIFLIGVDGCPHHHRHANELQRISDVNHDVSFIDAQGNTPERFVTHELLKRHLGYEISMSEFEQMEELPLYSVSA